MYGFVSLSLEKLWLLVMHVSGKLREFSAVHEVVVCLIEIAEQMFIMVLLATATPREWLNCFIVLAAMHLC